jgi:hypothetical protein
MPKYSDVELAEKMANSAKRLLEAASEFDSNLEHATISHGNIGVPFYTEPTMEEVMDDIKSLELDVKDATKNLKAFDRELGKLLALRMTLAEETGLPMNLTGASEWSRLIEYYM